MTLHDIVDVVERFCLDQGGRLASDDELSDWVEECGATIVAGWVEEGLVHEPPQVFVTTDGVIWYDGRKVQPHELRS